MLSLHRPETFAKQKERSLRTRLIKRLTECRLDFQAIAAVTKLEDGSVALTPLNQLPRLPQ